MIRLEQVSKRFEGSARFSVENLSLDVAEGTTIALIGPSGCGKTTVLRMINRLIEPTSGRIFVDGQDTSSADPIELRRQIGYVIQNVGLFPHLTVAENIAAVPRLLHWDERRIRSRIDELFELIGLKAGEYARRYPKQLSGGQRQRVGVARALAANPPILLMDEPFAAIDPIARQRLQDEFKQILGRVKKTVVIVTHDIGEAVRLGDTMAIMRDGRIAQMDTPDAVLQKPDGDFVTAFIGADRALRRLELFRVKDAMSAGKAAGGRATVDIEDTLHHALAILISSKSENVAVTENGAVVGTISSDAILRF